MKAVLEKKIMNASKVINPCYAPEKHIHISDKYDKMYQEKNVFIFLLSMIKHSEIIILLRFILLTNLESDKHFITLTFEFQVKNLEELNDEARRSVENS